MAIVSCPECGKKLKVADTSVGKKVKCSCANVFVATVASAPAAPAAKKPPATAALTAEKVFVSCTECDAKLKVATTSLGKKMKCPKCAAVFLANLPEEAPAKGRGPLAELDGNDLLDDDAPPPPKAKGKPKAKPGKDDMDDFFAFAQQEADQAPPAEEDDAIMPSSRGKGGWGAGDDDMDEEEPQPRGKGKKPAKPARRRDEEDEEEPQDTKPVYPRRTLLNVFVALMLLVYFGLLVDAFLFNFHDIDLYGLLDLPKPAPIGLVKKKGPTLNPPKKGNPSKTAPPFDFAARHKEELGWLASYRKGVRPEGFVASLKPHETKIVGIAFSPATPILAAVTMEHKKEGVKLWDLTTLTPTRPIEVEIKGARPLAAFSPDGEYIAIASGPPDQFLKVFQVADGAAALEVKLDKTPHGLAFSADGRRLTLTLQAPGGADLKEWTTWDWQEAALEGKVGKVSDYVLSPDAGKLLAVTQAGPAMLHDLTAKKTRPIAIQGPIAPEARMTRDGKALVNPVSKDAEFSLQWIDLDTGETLELAEEKEKIVRVQISPDSKFVLYETAAGEHKLLDVATKMTRWSAMAEIDAIAFSPGGVFLARTDMGAVQLLAVDELLAARKVDEPKKKKEEPKTKIDEPKDKKDDPKDKKDAPKNADDAAAEKTIRSLGGRLIRDDAAPGKPVVEVDWRGGKASDANLATLLAFPELRKLELGSAQVTGVGLTALANLKKLEYLDLNFGPLNDDGMKAIATLKSLKFLNVLNSKITDTGLKEIVSLRELEHLVVGQNKIGDAGLTEVLAALKNLRKLEIGNTQAGDEAAKAIAGLEQLTVLHCYGTQISDEGMKSLAGLTKLEELRVSYRVTDKSLKELAGLKELRVLNLFAASVGDAGMKELAGLDKMENLDLSGTQVSDKGLASLAGMKALRDLRVDRTPISDAGVKTIAQHKALQTLSLVDTKISDASLKELTQLPMLRTLFLRNTKLSDEAIAEFKKAAPKCQVFK